MATLFPGGLGVRTVQAAVVLVAVVLPLLDILNDRDGIEASEVVGLTAITLGVLWTSGHAAAITAMFLQALGSANRAASGEMLADYLTG